MTLLGERKLFAGVSCLSLLDSHRPDANAALGLDFRGNGVDDTKTGLVVRVDPRKHAISPVGRVQMCVVAQINEHLAPTAIGDVKVCHGCCAASIRCYGARAARLVDGEIAVGIRAVTAVTAKLDNEIGPVKTGAVIQIGVDNFGDVGDCSRSRFRKELQVDGAENCVDNEEAHGCVAE